MHADVAAHEGEGVDGFVLHHEEIDVLAPAFRNGEEARADRRDIVRHLGVVEVGGIDAHVAHDAVADGALLRVRERGGGGVAQIGQALRGRRERHEGHQEEG